MLRHRELTDGILGAFFCVFRTLGGLLPEVVYRRAMAIELRARGYSVVEEPIFKITYSDQVVGRCKADLLVNEIAVIEIKAARLIA